MGEVAVARLQAVTLAPSAIDHPHGRLQEAQLVFGKLHATDDPLVQVHDCDHPHTPGEYPEGVPLVHVLAVDQHTGPQAPVLQDAPVHPTNCHSLTAQVPHPLAGVVIV